MELVLTDLNKSVEFQSQLQEVSLVCEVEYSGSTTLRDIHIIVSNIIEYYYLNWNIWWQRKAVEYWDKGDGYDLLRLESDVGSVKSSPHLFAIMVDRSLAFSLSINNLYYEFLIRGFVFELWVEGTKLMGNMDMATAWAAFFHLCFCFDIKYPKVWIIVIMWKTNIVLLDWRICSWYPAAKYGEIWWLFRHPHIKEIFCCTKTCWNLFCEVGENIVDSKVTWTVW